MWWLGCWTVLASVLLTHVACQVCLEQHEQLMYTRYSDNTCDGPGERLEQPELACRCKNRYVRRGDKCIRGSKCISPCKGEREEYVLAEYEDPTCKGPGALLPCPVNACRCTHDYVRDENGECIRYSDCPSHCLNPDEVYLKTKTTDKTCAGPGKPLPYTVKECRCRSGFVRYMGICIRHFDCPTCGDHEIFSITTLQDPTCVGLEKELDEPVEECRCRGGFVRHDGECIFSWMCPSCEINEEYTRTKTDDSLCTLPGERFDTLKEGCFCRCDHVRFNGMCIPRDDCPICYGINESLVYTDREDSTCGEPGGILEQHEEGCRCIEDHVRFNGVCVHVDDCPICGDNEEMTISTSADPTCVGPEESMERAVECCRCLHGYVRLDGECIPPNMCPSCGINEVYSRSAVLDSLCSVQGITLKEPIEGCFCLPDHVRYNDECVPKNTCPTCLGKNEILILTDEEDPTCLWDGDKLEKPKEICRCLEDHVRFNGVCIPEDDCPNCGLNEALVETEFDDLTCVDEPAKPLLESTETCRCLEGYVRRFGECIPLAECPRCKTNEIYTFSKRNDSLCTVAGNTFDSPLEGCFCIDKHVRYNGECIESQDCPTCSGPNEILILTDHEDSTCINDGVEMFQSAEMCRCKPKHVRFNGVCIPERDCPKCGENENLVRTNRADSTCVGASEASKHYTEACRCIDGYVRYKGACVAKDDCPTCSLNEIYKLSYMEDSLCSSIGAPFYEAKEGCFCKDSHVRFNGVCLHVDDCPDCYGINEILTYAFSEDSTCIKPGAPMEKPMEVCRCDLDHVRFEGRCIPEIYCPVCFSNEELIYSKTVDGTCVGPEEDLDEPVETCRCIPGYVRYEGWCIAIDECPTCGVNEVYKNSLFEDSRCTVDGDELPWEEEDCYCIEGYVRFKGVCIARDECPKCKDGPNEALVLTMFGDYNCVGIGAELNGPVEACRCIEDHVRFNGKCIPQEKCPICYENEEFTMSTRVDSTCAGPEDPLPQPIEACRCIEGYVKYQGVCILSSDCPSCEQNEIYRFSSQTDRHCSVSGVSLDKPTENCYCISGYVRYFGVCIPQEECPTCSNNEVLVFTSNDDSTCTTAGATILEPNEYCRCIDKHVRYNGVCILQEDCPKCPGDNEALVMALYNDSTCTMYGAGMAEPKEVCRCTHGHVRHNGKCIPMNQCPNCDGENEALVLALYEDSTCTTSGAGMPEPAEVCRCQGGFVRYNGLCIASESCPLCPGHYETLVLAHYEDSTCTMRGAQMPKPAEVCRCNNGFVRLNGECISRESCPTCDGDNEIFVRAQYDDPRCSGPGMAMPKAAEVCRCMNGFVRYQSCCIPRDECPTCPGEFEGLIYATNEDATCTSGGMAMREFREVCRCHIGYVRHKGVCIAKDNCPTCAGDNEEYVMATSEDTTCCEVGNEIEEPIEACRCKFGYVRHEGHCIAADECP